MHLLYIHWNPDPDIFTIPGIDWPVRWYGLMWALAFIASHFIMNRIYRTEGRTEKQLDLLTVYIIAGTVLGARLGHCLFYGPHFDYVDPETGILHEGYLSHPLNILKVYEGGLASHGGAIGIIIAMWLYCRKTKENWLWIFDRIVVVVPLAGMFIRFGNLMNSEIIGTPTTLPWGFIFEQNESDIINLKTLGIPIPARHPGQLYEAVFCLGLFLLMYWLWKNKRNRFGRGFMFGLLCVLLFTERFFVEFVKENQENFEDNMLLNMGQILSIPLVLTGFFFMWRAQRKQGEKAGGSLQ